MGIPNPDVTQQPRKQTVEALEFTFSPAECLRINRRCGAVARPSACPLAFHHRACDWRHCLNLASIYLYQSVGVQMYLPVENKQTKLRTV